MRNFKSYIPIVTRFCLAPFGFIIVAVMAMLNIDFGSSLRSDDHGVFFLLVIAACINTFIASIILILMYLLILKITRVWSRHEVVNGIVYLSLFQLFFVIFTMTDLVIVLKEAVEHMLYFLGNWSFSEGLDHAALIKQTNYRDLWISVIYFLGNSTLSAMFTVLICRFGYACFVKMAAGKCGLCQRI